MSPQRFLRWAVVVWGLLFAVELSFVVAYRRGGCDASGWCAACDGRAARPAAWEAYEGRERACEERHAHAAMLEDLVVSSVAPLAVLAAAAGVAARRRRRGQRALLRAGVGVSMAVSAVLIARVAGVGMARPQDARGAWFNGRLRANLSDLALIVGGLALAGALASLEPAVATGRAERSGSPLAEDVEAAASSPPAPLLLLRHAAPTLKAPPSTA